MLGIFRNDFMMNFKESGKATDDVTAEHLELKQIEFNSIASSFAGLTQQIGELHRSVHFFSHSITLFLCFHLYFMGEKA